MYKYVKRLIGFFGALLGIIVLSPVFLIVTIWLHFANKGAGAFFYQTRIGKNEKFFNIIKYKTMRDAYDETGEPLPDSVRLTKVGRFVRATSLDEIPQLFNILKGDMAFIGPRPLPIIYMPFFTREEAHRHDVTPGISGWAQVNGRKNITWDNKLQLDLYYVKHMSFMLDAKIFLTTILKVFKRENVGVETSNTCSLDDIRTIQRPEYEGIGQRK